MIKNYINTAWRNLLRSKVYSFIAVFGLAIGLSVSILLFWGVDDELSYDKQWADAGDIYRINARVKLSENNFDTWINMPAPAGAAALKYFPGVLQQVRYNRTQALVTLGDEHITEKNVANTESSFFDIFHIRFITGNVKIALSDASNVVLSEQLAIKYFGSANHAMGKTILLGEKKLPFIVSAVMENMPERSSVKKDMLLSLDVVRKDYGGNGKWKTIDEDWGNFSFTTFIKLKPGTDIAALEKGLSAMHVTNNGFVKPGDVTYILQPLNTLRLYNPDLSEAGIKVVRFFVLIGILIILIAVINYINLSTARATKRAKEVGLRRAIGANRKQLIFQFVIEFVLIFAAALLLAAMTIPLLVPIYQSISGKNYTIDYWSADTLKIIIWVGLGTIVMASLYPAWVLSSFSPSEVLKSNFNTSMRGSLLRKTLVVLQFTVSITLIICTIVVSQQMHFIQTKNLGYNRENVFVIGMNADMGHDVQTVINELKTNRNIADVTFATGIVMDMGSSTDNISWPGKLDVEAHISPMQVAANFTAMMRMQFAAGSGFTGAPADSAYYLVNEAAVKLMNLKTPIGTRVTLWGKNGEIRGVLKDFNNTSLKTTVPLTIFSAARSANYGGYLYVKANSEGAKEAVAKASQVYHHYNPVRPFDFQFMDDNFDAMYRKEIQTGELFKAFAGVAILLSCLGLFGLAVFTAERRTKEIGIRKVLGASVQHIAVLVSREFAWLVFIANIVAWPFAWYFASTWIQTFAYRVAIGWWIFALAGALSLILAVVTVSSQAVRVALINPVKSLKTE